MRKTLRYALAVAAGTAAGIALALALASPPGHAPCHHQVAGAVPSPATAVQRAIASAPPICG